MQGALARACEASHRCGQRWEDARAILAKAEALEPYAALVHAQLAIAHAHLADSQKAQFQLKAAERYDDGDPGVQQLLAEGYDILNQTPQAVEHYEKFVETARKAGVKARVIDVAEKKASALKATLVPQPFKLSSPHDFTPAELAAALKERLTRQELRLVITPWEISSPMKRWAHKIVGDTSDAKTKAERLFRALTIRIEPRMISSGSTRTAQEAFRNWENLDYPLSCQDYALLYVALAREVGVKCFYVLVQKDYRDEFTGHACAGIFVGGNAFLVDPYYHWFGVPHRNFRVLNDIEAVGVFLAQAGELSKRYLAAKLFPDCSFVQLNLALALVATGRHSDACQVIEEAQKVDADDSAVWMERYVRAVIADSKGDWNASRQYARKCLDLKADHAHAWYFLAEAEYHLGLNDDAREHYENYLMTGSDAQTIHTVHKRLAHLADISPQANQESGSK